jgi:hypothetical protein
VDFTPRDLSHVALLAILMDRGGSIDLPAEAFDPGALMGPDGSWHAVALEPLPGGDLRISVRPRPAGDAAGIRTEPLKWRCPNCDTYNDAAVCIVCDTPRPEPS